MCLAIPHLSSLQRWKLVMLHHYISFFQNHNYYSGCKQHHAGVCVTSAKLVSAHTVLATSIPADDDRVTCIPLLKLGQGRTSLSTLHNLMNLAALAGTAIPQHATFTRESLIYRENPRFAVGFSCLQLFSTECRRCGRKVWVVFIPFCFAMWAVLAQARR